MGRVFKRTLVDVVSLLFVDYNKYMKIQLYNNLPTWAMKMNAGGNSPSIVIDVPLSVRTKSKIKTKKSGVRRNLG